ncbi:putative mediator of RNA polymerase II transcription subunit 15 [Musca domestica]|uniref:Mediator of RNA polymerase II transcription subunit 15 n=1 Tax=Musca domestica TaxID=7370 RepID=A0ABM3VKM2_MUSDO|nr:putative mediator of RNA polymerase II transcription subunit 15 [Musca domestica]
MVSSVVTVGVLILALGASAIRADVAHLGYSRYSRPQTLRLQRLEGRPTPYPASGYRPNKEFHLPGEQPEFPLGSHPQKPQQGRPQQPQQQNFNNNAQQGNFNNSPRQPNFNTNPQQQNFGNNPQPATFNNSPRQPNFNTNPQQATFSNNNNPQQQFFTFAPEQTYGAPERQPQPQPQPEVEVEQQSEVETQDVINSGSNQLGEPQQRPNGLYAAPARLRQAPARLQQQQRQQPQRLYATPQSGRLTAAQQSSRLTDNREEDEEDGEDTNTEIETEMKKEEEEKKNASTAPAAGQNLATIAYYPTGAFSFVQPLGANFVATAPKAAYVTTPSAGYVSATGTYVTAAAAAPTSAIYQTPSFVAASPYVQQPLTFAAAPAQLNACGDDHDNNNSIESHLERGSNLHRSKMITNIPFDIVWEKEG